MSTDLPPVEILDSFDSDILEKRLVFRNVLSNTTGR